MPKFAAIIQLLRLNKPVGILLLLYPCLLALIVSFDFQINRVPIKLWLVFIIGSILMRSAGCAINDFFDRDIDKYVQRTQNRPLTSGLMQSQSALLITAILILMAAFLLYFLPKRSYVFIILALILAITYPLAKRWLSIPQSYLALAFSMSMPVAYFSNPDRFFNNSNIVMILWLMFANFIWVLAYDTFYSMVDKKDDQFLKIKTASLYFGRYDYAWAWFFYSLTHFLFLGFLYIYAINFDFNFNFKILNIMQYLLIIVIISLFIKHSIGLRKYFIIEKIDLLVDNPQTKQARDFCFRIFYEQKYMGLFYVLLYAIQSI